jgi:predicted dienelactone hydrolase
MGDYRCRDTLREAALDALKLLTELLSTAPRAPRDVNAPVAPNNRHVQTGCWPDRRLREVLSHAGGLAAEFERRLQVSGAVDGIQGSGQ